MKNYINYIKLAVYGVLIYAFIQVIILLTTFVKPPLWYYGILIGPLLFYFVFEFITNRFFGQNNILLNKNSLKTAIKIEDFTPTESENNTKDFTLE